MNSHSRGGKIRITAGIVLVGVLATGGLAEAGERRASPTAMQQGTAMAIEGTLEVLHADDSAGGKYWFFLQTAGGTLKLRFLRGMPTHVRTGDRVRVKGLRVGADELIVDGPADVQPVK